MKQLRTQIFSKSRSRSFLWKLCIGTILFGLVVGFLSGLFEFKSGLTLQSRIESRLISDASEYSSVDDIKNKITEAVLQVLGESFESGELETEELLIEIPYLHLWLPLEKYSQLETLLKQYLRETDSELVLLFLNALGAEPEPAKIKLEQLAGGVPVTRYANQILGLIATNAELFNKAYPYYLKEGAFPEANWARKQAVQNRSYKKDFEALEALASDPLYSDAFNPWIRAEMAGQNRDWLNTIKWNMLGQLAGVEIGSFVLATIAMVVWSTILMQLCQVKRFDQWTPLLCLFGLLLGVLSITPTLLWIMLEDMFLPISEGEDLFHAILYYIATVGLREEVCKLLLFLPLAPILIKRGNELEFLLVASFVGLGFAYEENLNYLSSSMGTATTGRFLTANFFHISLTGMCGLFFCRMWRIRGYSYNDFLFIFGVAVVAHGLYDAFLSPGMNDGGMATLILFILFSKFYFKEAHGLRDSSQSTISLSATMAFGISLLTASLLVYLSLILSLSQAFQLAFGSLISSAIILFMFFREFNESFGD